MLAGCAATGSTVAPEAIPGSAAEVEVHRLAKTRLQLAALHFEEGRAEVALGEVAQALQAYPRYVDAYNLKGWIHMSLQDYKAANESFVQALALRPGDADTLYNLGWLQCQQKQFTLADRNLDAALQAPRTQWAIGRADLAGQRGVLATGRQIRGCAAGLGKRRTKSEPGSPAVAYNFANALHARGYRTSVRVFMCAVSNNGQWASAPSLCVSGDQSERSLGDRVAMRQLADQLHKRFPDSRNGNGLSRELLMTEVVVDSADTTKQ